MLSLSVTAGPVWTVARAGGWKSIISTRCALTRNLPLIRQIVRHGVQPVTPKKRDWNAGTNPVPKTAKNGGIASPR